MMWLARFEPEPFPVLPSISILHQRAAFFAAYHTVREQTRASSLPYGLEGLDVI